MPVRPLAEDKDEEKRGLSHEEEEDEEEQEEDKEQDQEEQDMEGKEEDEEIYCQLCEEGEEGRSPVRMPAPCRPSKQEIEEHELTHTPFRSWCKFCVKGRANNNPHRRRNKEDEEKNLE